MMNRNGSRNFLKLVLALSMALAAPLALAADGGYLVYVGTYTGKGSQGIYAYRFDPVTGKIADLGLAAETENPSFVAVDKAGKYLYAVNEVGDFAGKKSGAISVFSINAGTGKLTIEQELPTMGADPAHLSLDHSGRDVLVANYTGGSVVVFPIQKDGKLGDQSAFVQHSGSSVNKERQAGPHAHEIRVTEDDRYALVADLGLDELLVYRFDAKKGTLEPNDVKFAKIEAGAGPRHFEFSANSKFVYVTNEMASTVTVFGFDAKKGRLKELQTISTLPKDFRGENSTAEIMMGPSGTLYVSNRGANTIAAFAVDAKTGKLSEATQVATGIKTPRHFAIDPTGQWMWVEGQESNDIHLFKVSSDGKLTATDESLKVVSPVCVVFVKE